jgi:hypothetical protein
MTGRALVSKGLNAFLVVVTGVGLALSQAARAAAVDPPPLTIHRASGPITIDGDLSDEGWKDATRVDVWYETNPGDNVAPKVRSIGYVAYDSTFFYAGFDFEDPDPRHIRAPYADRDNVNSDTDYGGVILDTRNDGRTGIEFLVNPRGVQYDAVNDDASGNEDTSPDFFWDAAARITEKGWSLEIRIPFSSLRYSKADPRTWGIMLYRNYPREFRYQMFSTTLPRGGQCFICRSNKLTGLADLPSGGHLVVAPYANASRVSAPVDDELGRPLEGHSPEGHVGFDMKWTPGANTAVDATVKPDFSQIESDTAQIAANERFALFYPEKRPFFLEGVELLASPVQAVYTRTITAPRWGTRATGKLGSTAYTVLVAQDAGGGSVVIPGALSSDLANQEFRSLVSIARVRRDLGHSFVGLLATDREIDGGGYNRVFGPDLQWRPSEKDTVTGQILFSGSQTPVRPDLAAEWDGRSLSGHGVSAWWSHSTRRVDLFTNYKDLSNGFRADDGFVPQVGIRDVNGEYGYTFRPTGFLSRLRPFVNGEYTEDRAGVTLERQLSFGAGMDGRYGTFARLRYAFDHVRTGGLLLPQRQLLFSTQANPVRWLTRITLNGRIGDAIDFDNHRTGTGADVTLGFVVRPTSHLDLNFQLARRWLNVRPQPGPPQRLFTAQVDRLRATYTFTARMFLRGIAQYVDTRRDPTLYLDPVTRRSGSVNLSLLLGYRLNWQTVLFAGYGDDREMLTETEHLEPQSRSLFVKVSYAIQR